MKPKNIPAAVLTIAFAIGACSGSDAADTSESDTSTAPVVTEVTPVLDDDESPAEDADVQMFPDVIGAVATQNGETWTIDATISSPYDSPERYADAFRILTPNGTVLGERILTHDHADEQPFTRSEPGIVIPDDVSMLTIEGRDLEFGYGGETYQLDIVR